MAFPASDALVTAMEARLGRRLPEPHRQRLIRDNGGSVAAAEDTWTLHPVWDPTDRRTIARTANHIVRETSTIRDALGDGFPPGAVAVGSNDGGDYLVLRPGHEDVEIWDHETGQLVSADLDWG